MGAIITIAAAISAFWSTANIDTGPSDRANAAASPASSDADSDVREASAGLAIPVEGVTTRSLVDTYRASRGGGTGIAGRIIDGGAEAPCAGTGICGAGATGAGGGGAGGAGTSSSSGSSCGLTTARGRSAVLGSKPTVSGASAARTSCTISSRSASAVSLSCRT